MSREESQLEIDFGLRVECKRPLAADFRLLPVIHINSNTRGTRRLQKKTQAGFRRGLGVRFREERAPASLTNILFMRRLCAAADLQTPAPRANACGESIRMV